LQQSIKTASVAHRRLDVLINNVANDQRMDPRTVTPDQWRASMAVNLDPAFFAAQAAEPFMVTVGSGSIINFSSINALFGPAQMPSYVTAKSALLGMTKSLATDFGKDNIRVNTILPGWIITEKQLDKWLTPEAEAQWMDQVALRRRIMPEDVANLALFLGSDDAALITSQHFTIDGGRL
jgi:NAD(P)-dependent dehydrogenase (short-subunit alcohol dehydrogenase family)